MDDLVEEGLRYLRTIYPDDFTELRHRQHKAFNPIYAIGVVNLARLTGANDLLPMAIADCAKLGATVFQGFTHEDGTREFLSASDLPLCIQAKDRLTEARMLASFRIFGDLPAGDCDDVAGDQEDLGCFLPGLPDEIKKAYICTPDVWKSWTPAIKEYLPGLCNACRNMLKTSEMREQRYIFESLPSFVGVKVDGWECEDSD